MEKAIRPARVHGTVRLPGDKSVSHRALMFGALTPGVSRARHVADSADCRATRRVDHVMLATGYRVDISRYEFLSAGVLRALRVSDGYPELGAGLESSVAGLHFLGAPAARSFGPLCRFVSGTSFAAQALTRRILGRNGFCLPPLLAQYL